MGGNLAVKVHRRLGGRNELLAESKGVRLLSPIVPKKLKIFLKPLDFAVREVDDIDEEVALLHELKEVVLEFIRQIKQTDFSKDSDVKLLYEKAKIWKYKNLYNTGD